MSEERDAAMDGILRQVSIKLLPDTALRLIHEAYQNKISRSTVVEYALAKLFESDNPLADIRGNTNKA